MVLLGDHYMSVSFVLIVFNLYDYETLESQYAGIEVSINGDVLKNESVNTYDFVTCKGLKSALEKDLFLNRSTTKVVFLVDLFDTTVVLKSKQHYKKDDLIYALELIPDAIDMKILDLIANSKSILDGFSKSFGLTEDTITSKELHNRSKLIVHLHELKNNWLNNTCL